MEVEGGVIEPKAKRYSLMHIKTALLGVIAIAITTDACLAALPRPGNWQAFGSGRYADGVYAVVWFNFVISENNPITIRNYNITISVDKSWEDARNKGSRVTLLDSRMKRRFEFSAQDAKIDIVNDKFILNEGGLVLEGTFNSKKRARGTWRYEESSVTGTVGGGILPVGGRWKAAYITSGPEWLGELLEWVSMIIAISSLIKFSLVIVEVNK